VVAPRWYRWSLLGAFVLLAVALAVGPPGGRANWVLGNIPALVGLATVALCFWRFPLSSASSTMLVAFLALHEVGTHFGYRVPWEAVESGRNGYDRVVHAAFGLLLTPPLREALTRSGRAAGAWADFLAVALVLAAAAFYEVTEWIGAELFWDGPAEDVLGFQGDPLDTTKDMALALGGSLVAAAAGALARRFRRARASGTANPAGAKG
jgi:putative membrane protein